MIWSPIWGSKYECIEKAKCYEHGSVHDVYFWVQFYGLDFPSTDLLTD